MLHLASARHATRGRGLHVHPRTPVLLASALPEARLAHAIADNFPVLEAEAARPLAASLFRRIPARVLFLIASLTITIVARLCKWRVFLWSVVAAAQLSHVRHRMGTPHQGDAESDEQPEVETEHPATTTTNVRRAIGVIDERTAAPILVRERSRHSLAAFEPDTPPTKNESACRGKPDAHPRLHVCLCYLIMLLHDSNRAHTCAHAHSRACHRGPQ